MSHLSPELLDSLAEGGAPSVEQSAHLESCPDCSRQLRGMRKYFTLMKSLPNLKAPAGFSARLRQRLEAEAAMPGWKRFLSTLFTIRRIPLQLAGAGFAALLLFWALPRYQNLVPQSETDTAKNQPAPSSSASENATIVEEKADDKAETEDEKASRPEPPRPPLPSDLAAKKSAARMGAGAGAVVGNAEGRAELDGKDLPWSKTEDLAVIEVTEASTPKPVKTELPPASPSPAKEQTAPAQARKKAALASGAVPKAALKAEANPSPDMAVSMKSEDSHSALREEASSSTLAEAPAAAIPAPAPVPTTDSLLRALGFHRENRRGLSVQILHVARTAGDSVQFQLREMGLEKLLILRALPGDSLEIEIR